MSSPDFNNSEYLSDIKIVGKLNQAKFGVYLAHSPSTDNCFALKLFPYANDKANSHFLNEIRFSKLSHPNIISTIGYKKKTTIYEEEGPINVSYIVTELAPYGDFYDVLLTRKIYFDEKLARTYFHQLIEGLQYLHSHRVGHMDIKPDNLLLSQDFNLKIGDFDTSMIQGTQGLQGHTKRSSGTLYYRAPEVIAKACNDLRAADIYSAAIVLFLFKCGGTLPHLEHEEFDGCDLADLLYNNTEAFWEKHCEIQGKADSFFDEDFQNLFISMTKMNPKERATLSQVKGSKWYNGPIYSQEELEAVMMKKLNV